MDVIAYGRKYKDQRTSVAKIKADLEWSAAGKGKFTPNPPISRVKSGGQKRKKKGNRKARQ